MERKEGRRNRSDDAERKVGECLASVGETRLRQSREKLWRGLNLVALAGGVRLMAQPELVAVLCARFMMVSFSL